MTKVVLNGCYGGFGLSAEAMVEILKRKGKPAYVFKRKWGEDKEYLCTNPEEYSECQTDFYIYDNPDKKGMYYWDCDFSRTDPDVIAVVEMLGEKANGQCADLFVEEYDDENFSYWIDEYDGAETLMLEPIVSEKKLMECKNVSEIIAYLESLDIAIKKMSA